MIGERYAQGSIRCDSTMCSNTAITRAEEVTPLAAYDNGELARSKVLLLLLLLLLLFLLLLYIIIIFIY